MKSIFKKLSATVIMVIMIGQLIPSATLISVAEQVIDTASAQDYTWTFDDTITNSDTNCLWGCDTHTTWLTCSDGSMVTNPSDCPFVWQDTCAINPNAIGCAPQPTPTPNPTPSSPGNTNSWTWQDTCATNPNALGCSSAANTYWCIYTNSWVQSSAYCPESTGPVPSSVPVTSPTNSWSWQTTTNNTYWCNTTGMYVQSSAYCPSTVIQYATIIPTQNVIQSPTNTNFSWGSWGTTPTTVVTPVVQQYRCWDNSVVSNPANCPTQTKVCSGGIIVQISQNCPAQTKTCPNGTVIAIDQNCPAQTKPCANGTVVGINDVCYKTCPNGYTYPESSTCPAQTCSNGAINPSSCNQCASGYEYINNKCLQPCASGYTRNGESCDRVTYRCAGGQIVYNQADCPAVNCTNGATNPPSCNQFPSCTNGAVNSPSCNQCASGYEYWGSRCVAACQTNYVRNSSTGACDPRACTNGAIDAPNCSVCPNGQEMVSGSCAAVCPSNTYRTSSGCTAYTCTNGATNYAWCNICPTGKYMINGSCQSCQTGQSYDGRQCVSNQCSNGAINSPSCNQCQAGYEYVNNKCLLPCPYGYTRSGDSCNLIPINNCTNGAINSPSCNQCASGYELLQNRCLQICPTGYIRSGLNCQIETRTCWDNSQVVLTQACPPQYKYCPGSGNSVLVTQACPVVPVSPVPVPTTPIAIAHRVITTSASMITDTSARCNGIGIITSDRNSSGWFEYGNTPALGYTTQVGYIGNTSNVNYAAPITGLKPLTTYYCRAVMSNSDGTWKGDIVSFNTSATPVKYVEQPKPVVKPATTVKTNKTDLEKITYTSTTYTCKDTTGGTVDIKSGDKLMTINLNRDGNSLYTSKDVVVKAEYENTSKINLTDVELRVSIPNDIEVVSTSQGSYDNTLKEVRVNLKDLAAGQKGVIILTLRAKSSAENNKTVVLTGYANYFLTTSSGEAYKDETSSYVIYQIVNDGAGTTSDASSAAATGKKSTTTSSNAGFLPSTFLGWLSLIIVLFILVIISRTLWGVWKGKSAGAHH